MTQYCVKTDFNQAVNFPVPAALTLSPKPAIAHRLTKLALAAEGEKKHKENYIFPLGTQM